MDSRDDLYKVVVNADEQYSILPINTENPPGYRDIKIAITREKCIAYINDRYSLNQIIRQTSPWYRFFLKWKHKFNVSYGYPFAPWVNSVLKTNEEIDAAVSQVRQLGLPIVDDLCKNWDSLAALYLVLKKTRKTAKIFDAGGELYSMILPWLSLYGYRNLIAGNLVFSKEIKKGPIIYKYEDLCKTDFDAETFDAITCLSVIEHGIELTTYFPEMARILKPGGLLIISADYYETPIDTKGQMAYGVPIHIFTRDEIKQALKLANQCGFQLTSELDLTVGGKPIFWKEYELRYTFVLFSLQKYDGSEIIQGTGNR